MNFKNQLELFNFIWDTRFHVSEISGDYLLPKGNSRWHFQFCHILSKGSYPLYKLNPDNIILMTVSEHERQETFKRFLEKRQELKRRYYEEYYNNIKQII